MPPLFDLNQLAVSKRHSKHPIPSRRLPSAANASTRRGSPRRGLAAGWVIARLQSGGPEELPSHSSRPPRAQLRCLQLGTGQWCPLESATWFPIRTAAESYVDSLGYSIGVEVEIRHVSIDE